MPFLTFMSSPSSLLSSSLSNLARRVMAKAFPSLKTFRAASNKLYYLNRVKKKAEEGRVCIGSKRPFVKVVSAAPTLCSISRIELLDLGRSTRYIIFTYNE